MLSMDIKRLLKENKTHEAIMQLAEEIEDLQPQVINMGDEE